MIDFFPWHLLEDKKSMVEFSLGKILHVLTAIGKKWKKATIHCSDGSGDTPFFFDPDGLNMEIEG